ncbi:hypothetical protein M0812_03858 [Anaeramoeba flamelloides]|uniref:BZIP domain-containing protein n=1 Tax=Anaeramoeba flamelloides TaxID=1746091 RepID=A0AAV8AJJ7_9EUKA|nr:hypothetical protein M0812_03858 [Anaeramoeba flamelloides]
MTELNVQEKSPMSLNSPNFDELLRSDLTPRSDEMINDYSSPLTSPLETPFQTTNSNDQQEQIEITDIQEHLVEREYRPRKRSRKIKKKKKKLDTKFQNSNFKERNWNDQNKTKLEEQVFELTLRELRTKQKNLTIDEYVKILEEEVCKLSVQNIVHNAKVDALNEERTQTHKLVLDLRETNTAYRKKIKRFSNQNKKLKSKLRNLQAKGKEQNVNQNKNKTHNENGNENQNQNQAQNINLNLLNNETKIEIQNENQETNNFNSTTQEVNHDKAATVTQNNQISLNSVSMDFENEQSFPSFGYDLDQIEYEERMKKEFDSIMQNNGENFDPNSLFDGVDLSLLTSMTAPKLDTKLEMFKKIYLQKKKNSSNKNNDKSTVTITSNNNNNANINNNNNNSNKIQTDKKIFNPEYKKIEKDQIKELSKNLKQLKIVNNGDNKINENEKKKVNNDYDNDEKDDESSSDDDDDENDDEEIDDSDYDNDEEGFEKILQKYQEYFSLQITKTVNEKIKILKNNLSEEK